MLQPLPRLGVVPLQDLEGRQAGQTAAVRELHVEQKQRMCLGLAVRLLLQRRCLADAVWELFAVKLRHRLCLSWQTQLQGLDAMLEVLRRIFVAARLEGERLLPAGAVGEVCLGFGRQHRPRREATPEDRVI